MGDLGPTKERGSTQKAGNEAIYRIKYRYQYVSHCPYRRDQETFIFDSSPLSCEEKVQSQTNS